MATHGGRIHIPEMLKSTAGLYFLFLLAGDCFNHRCNFGVSRLLLTKIGFLPKLAN